MKVFEGLHALIWQDMRSNNCNTYFIDGSKKIIIDPGHSHLFTHVDYELTRLSVTMNEIAVVIATHGHPDHFEAATRFPDTAQFAMGFEEYTLLKEVLGKFMEIPEPDFFLKEGDLTIGDETFHIIQTPGHTPGEICIYWPAKKALFSGDVVFREGIGRTDLPGGDGKQLKESIKRLAKLDVEYLLPGHGDIISGKDAVEKNFKMIELVWFSYLG
jgi:glyoxylase-like metal-dependent hydrolase (beta-lactamase superfamily II)